MFTFQKWEGTVLQFHDNTFQNRQHGCNVQKEQDDWLAGEKKKKSYFFNLLFFTIILHIWLTVEQNVKCLNHKAHWHLHLPDGSSSFNHGLSLLAGQSWLAQGHTRWASAIWATSSWTMPPPWDMVWDICNIHSCFLVLYDTIFELLNEIKDFSVLWDWQRSSLPDRCQKHLLWQCLTTGNRQSALQHQSPEL